MQNQSYTLEDIMTIASREGRIFSEQYMWFIMDQLANLLIPLHICGRIHGSIRPCNVVVSDGRLFLRDPQESTTFNGVSNYFYVSPDLVYTTKHDIYSIGKIIYAMSNGLGLGYYSPSLIKVMNAMKLPDPQTRPTVQDIIYLCIMSIRTDVQASINQFQTDYEDLYKSYVIQLQRCRKEINHSISMKNRLLEMEQSFFYEKVSPKNVHSSANTNTNVNTK